MSMSRSEIFGTAALRTRQQFQLATGLGRMAFGHHDTGKRSLMTDRDLLEYEDALEWWQQQRWATRETCEKACTSLSNLAVEAVQDLPLSHLFLETSDERLKIEQEITLEIAGIEASLLADMGVVLPAEVEATGLTDFSGWNLRDLSSFAMVGSSTGAAFTLGTRAVPGLLAMVGLGAASVVVAPLTIAAGAAGMAWSASSVAGNKRQSYLDALRDGIQRALLSESSPEASVMSRHHARLDILLNNRLGELS